MKSRLQYTSGFKREKKKDSLKGTFIFLFHLNISLSSFLFYLAGGKTFEPTFVKQAETISF